MARPRNFEDILSKLPGVRQSGDHWTAPCPLPGHKTPAGHLTLKDAGDKVLTTCQGGKHSYQDYCETWGFDSLTYSRNGNELEDNKQKTLVATFSYEYEKGKEAYQIRRFDLGIGHKTFEAWRKEGGEYIPGLPKGQKPILYKRPLIKGWIQQDKTIILPEGEGKVDVLVEKGFAATTAPFGAGKRKWKPQYTESLVGAKVAIPPDNDDVGRDYSDEKAKALYGVAKSVKILTLPNLPPKGDIIDWFKAGGTKEELERLIAEAPEWKPKENGLVCMSDVEPEEVEWLWYPYIPQGKLTLIDGDPGIGKSWGSLAIATSVSLGKGLPRTEATEPQKVILASAEDGLADTIRPRLDAMGANVANIYAINEAITFDDGGLAVLEVHIAKIKPSLVVIDPLVAYLGAGVDMHRSNETRAVMAKLADMAEKHNVAILSIRHLTKGGTLKPIYRGLGSIDFTAACRSVLLAGCDPENPQKRGLVHIKSNLAPTGNAIGYELRDGGFYWTEECDLTAGKILAAEDTEHTSVLGEAVDFLKDALAEGPVEARQIFKDAHSIGISDRTLNRAKVAQSVISKRKGEPGKRGGGRFFWWLPGDLDCQDGELKDDDQTQNDLGCQDCHIEDFGNLNQNRHENTSQGIGVGNVDPNPRCEAILGMPVEKALEIWRSNGAPIIHLGPGENCEYLEKLLSKPTVLERHLVAVKTWLEKQNQKPGEQGR